MLRGAAELQNYAIGATHGTVGHVGDFVHDSAAAFDRTRESDIGNDGARASFSLAPHQEIIE